MKKKRQPLLKRVFTFGANEDSDDRRLILPTYVTKIIPAPEETRPSKKKDNVMKNEKSSA
jgi:hypothetical protein